MGTHHAQHPHAAQSLPPLRIARAHSLAKHLAALTIAPGIRRVSELDYYFDDNVDLREQTINDAVELGLVELHASTFDVDVRLIDLAAAA